MGGDLIELPGVPIEELARHGGERLRGPKLLVHLVDAHEHVPEADDPRPGLAAYVPETLLWNVAVEAPRVSTGWGRRRNARRAIDKSISIAR